MVDATTMHKQVLVLRLISKYRTLGMLAADLDRLHQHAHDYDPDRHAAWLGPSRCADCRPRRYL